MYKFRGMKRKGKGKFFVSAERNGKGKEIFLFPWKEMEKERKIFPFRGSGRKRNGKSLSVSDSDLCWANVAMGGFNIFMKLKVL